MSIAADCDLWIHASDPRIHIVPGETLKHSMLLGQRAGSPHVLPLSSAGGSTKRADLSCKHHVTSWEHQCPSQHH